jgi:hypothetical protein
MQVEAANYKSARGLTQNPKSNGRIFVPGIFQRAVQIFSRAAQIPRGQMGRQHYNNNVSQLNDKCIANARNKSISSVTPQ